MSSPADGTARGWTNVAGVDARALRDVFGTFLTGVTVVTFRDADGVPRGFTANSFTSVSLNPPLVLVCIANTAGSFSALSECQRFAINILAESQKHASAAFGSRTGGRFNDVTTWSRDADGPPLIDGSLSSMECTREQVVMAGDHAIVIGRVQGFRLGTGGVPLAYFRGAYAALSLGTDVLEHMSLIAFRVRCLLDFGEEVLLVRRGDDAPWELPSIDLHAGDDHRQAIPRLLQSLGADADVGFLYSVYHEEGETHTTLVFRGVADQAAAARVRQPEGVTIGFFGRESMPWAELHGPSQSALLRRFFTERAQSRFGIYWEIGAGSRIATLQPGASDATAPAVERR